MSSRAKRFFGMAAAVGITLVVFGFFFLVVSQLPQPKPPSNVVTVDIYPAKPEPQ